MTTISRDVRNIDIFLADLETSIRSVRWLQDCLECTDVERVYPWITNWPTHPWFSLGLVDPKNPAASEFWQVAAALDRDGCDTTIKYSDHRLSAFCTKGDLVVQLCANVKPGSKADKNEFRSLTDLAQAL